MEQFVIYQTLAEIKARALAGTPSGQLLDQALEECLPDRRKASEGTDT